MKEKYSLNHPHYLTIIPEEAARYVLIHFNYDVDEWELYDLKTDPDEMINRYHDPKFAEIKKNLTAKLKGLQALYKVNSDNINNPTGPIR